MAATYEKAPYEVIQMANELLCSGPEHKILLDQKVKIDFLMAFAERDEKTGAPIGCAIKHQGVRALAIARKTNLKDRVMGRGDAEIVIDADHWNEIDELQQRAILDHELHHLTVKVSKKGVQTDAIGRPQIVLRLHDYQFGWFTKIAERYGRHSQERIQAACMMDEAGQFYWPTFCPAPGTKHQ